MHAVVFDFDGVVADTMPQHAEAYRRVLAPFGIPVDAERIFELEGARSEEIIRQLFDEVGTIIEHDEVQRLADEKQRVYIGLGDPPVFPAAARLVRQVQEATQTALVTGTRRDNLERLIPDLLPGFTAVLAAGDYQKGKPDPEPYLMAAQRLERPPSDCIAVENAPRGVASAKNAGYAAVLAITTTVSKAALHEADAVFDDHDRLADGLLRRLQGL